MQFCFLMYIPALCLTLSFTFIIANIVAPNPTTWSRTVFIACIQKDSQLERHSKYMMSDASDMDPTLAFSLELPGSFKLKSPEGSQPKNVGRRGPQLEVLKHITKEQILQLETTYSIREAANLLSISLSTLKRVKLEKGIAHRWRFRSLSVRRATPHGNGAKR